MKRLFIPALILTLCALSCAKSGDTPEKKGKSSFEESVMDIQASIDPFVDGEQTKNSFDPSTKTWTWTVKDQIGFWSDPSADKLLGNPAQVVFDVESVDGANAYFHGNGYGILRGCTYHTYYPYNGDATATAVPLSYTGQNPQENGGTGHLGSYDYLYSSEKAASIGNVSFQYHHLGCIAKFTITVNATNVANITKLTISTDDSQNETLVSNAVFNPFSPSAAMTKTYTQSIEYPLGKDQAGIKLNAENQLIVYTMMSPAAMAGKKFKATLLAANGNVYEGSSANALSKNQSAGELYPYAITAIDKTGVTDLSYKECANCYIVPASGKYMFQTKRYGESSNIANIASAEIYWETNNTSTAPTSATPIITNVAYSNGYITFTKPDTYISGNALIAAKNSAGTILWSWHIWCTDTPADQLYPNNAGYLMDRNLGAIGTSDEYSHGLLYQWGRKDPLMGHLALNKASLATSDVMTPNKHTEYPDAYTYTGSNSQEYSIQNPGPVLLSSSGEWQTSPIATNRWRNSDGGKTIHDPCPPGYKVMDGTQTIDASDRTGFYSKAYDINGTKYYAPGVLIDDIWSSQRVKSDNVSLSMMLADGTYAYYPADGYLTCTGARSGQNVTIWSDYPGGLYHNGQAWVWGSGLSNVLGTNITNPDSMNITPDWGSNRADSRSVRCQKMTTNIPLASGQPNENLGNSTPSPSAW